MKNRTALVCEDDASIRKMIAAMLERQGFGVETVQDGAEAIEALSQDRYDLVVLDLMMPGVDGFAVMDYVREHRPRQLRRVLITTAVPPSQMDRVPPGFCTILPKPFDMGEFVRHALDCSDDTLNRRPPNLQAVVA